MLIAVNAPAVVTLTILVFHAMGAVALAELPLSSIRWLYFG